MSGCRIGKVKMKDKKLHCIYQPSNVRTFNFKDGSVTLRMYDTKVITYETLLWFLEKVKNEVFFEI